MLGGLDFLGVFLGLIAQLHNVVMTEQGIAIK